MGFLQENNGASSSVRLIALAVTATCIAVFAYATVKQVPIPVIPESWIVFFGVGMGAKVGQKIFGENSGGDAPPTTTP